MTPPSPAARRPVPIDEPHPMLGGLTPSQFMKRHWQRKPLVIRAAVPRPDACLSRSALFALAAQESVESRLVELRAKGWSLRHGPFGPRSLPPLKRTGWTLLVQGVDAHLETAHQLLQRFRFVPDARLDDIMVSWASDGGGVGPHFDSYDVFLLQLSGHRRWRIGRQADLSLQPGLPLKILSHFLPEEEHVLGPGDMLYLPPRWAHDGVAVGGDCMTCSVGFRAPQRGGLAGELVQRMADEFEDETLYRDPGQTATERPAAMPAGLQAFAADALARLLAQPQRMHCALGEVMTEPKPNVWFDSPEGEWRLSGLRLDRRTRMMYDDRHVFINGESFLAAGADARLMRLLADQRALDVVTLSKASPDAISLLRDWFEAGWVFLDNPD